MITAHIGTDYLDLSSDFSFEHSVVSQLWNFEKLRGEYVPNISFPETEHNRTMLNHPNRFELRRNGNKVFEGFELRVDGYLIVRGTLVITDAFSGYVRGEVGNLSAAQEEKVISNWEDLSQNFFQNKASYNPVTDDYCAPTMVNDTFFADIGTTEPYVLPWDNKTNFEESILQHYHRMIGYAEGCEEFSVNGRDTSGLILEPSGLMNFKVKKGEYLYDNYTQPVVPMLYLFRTIERLLKKSGFFQQSNSVANTDLLRLAIYNNYSIVRYTVNMSKSIDRYNQWDNTVIDVSGVRSMNQSLGPFGFRELLPKITLKELLVSTQNLLNIAFVFSKSKYRIVDREAILTNQSVSIDKYMTGLWSMKSKTETIVKFTMLMDEGDLEVSGYYQDLTERAADFIEDVATFNELAAVYNPPMGSLCRVIKNKKIYEYGAGTAVDDHGTEYTTVGWKFVSIDYQPFLYNNVAEAETTLEIKTTASTVTHGELAGVVKQAGRSNIRKGTEAGFSLRLVFDNNNLGLNFSSNYYLNWKYSNNLLQKRWAQTARWLASREPVEASFEFPVNIYSSMVEQLAESDMKDLNSTKYSTRHGEFVIDKMTTRFTHSGIGPSKITGWKV